MFGYVQSNLTIYSTFGGHNEQFIASGSEDGFVRIWHRNFEQPVAVLDGHSKPVTCVHWNPAMCSMLATCSDDTLVHIWTTPESCCTDLLGSVNGVREKSISRQVDSSNGQLTNNSTNPSKPNNISVGPTSDGLTSDDGAVSDDDGDEDGSIEDSGESDSAPIPPTSANVRMVASGVGAAEVVAALMAGVPPAPLLHNFPQPVRQPGRTDSDTDDGQSDHTAASSGMQGSGASESGGF